MSTKFTMGSYELIEAPACHSWPLPLPGQTLHDWFPELCAICLHGEGEVVDHCHRTGLVRGYLCWSCNRREGRASYDPFRAYRRRPPAVIVGWTYQYDETNWCDTEAEQWLIDILGPVPVDDPAAAARYLAAASALPRSASRGVNNPLRRMGL
jgi:hypothetical protein